MLNIFKKSFSLQGIDEGHHRMTYKGVPALKCPFDYVLYQMLVFEVQPDLIIEIGTNKGGSTLYLADLLLLLNRGEIHTIDLPKNKEHELLSSHSKIKVFNEGFQKYDLNQIKNFQTIMVIEDGSHQYKETMEALNRFAPFVSVGSYFIVEDGIITELGRAKEFNGGPQRAIHEFLQTHTQFSIDRNWCDFFGENATFNTDGYLKRTA